MHRYTVIWTDSAETRLAELWNDNPRLRQEIADAADLIDETLAERPYAIGSRYPSGHVTWSVYHSLCYMSLTKKIDKYTSSWSDSGRMTRRLL